MNNQTIFNEPYPLGACTVAQIEDFEKAFSVHIPKDYKDYLCQFNGAKPVNDICCIPDDGATPIHHMYGLHDEDWCNIRVENDKLIFAGDAFGNEFAISLNHQEKYGAIYFIDRELEILTLISSSFDDFISSLVSEDEYMDNFKNENPELYESFQERLAELKRNPQI